MKFIEKEIKQAINRHSDQKYYLSKILEKIHQKNEPNPLFTDEDLKMKLEIFDIADKNSCFITGKVCKGVGDHIFEINGYYERTGRRGINDPWNIIQVCGNLNKSYKVFKFNISGINIKKDIGYQDLTDDEHYYLLSSNNSEYIKMGIIYEKIKNWKIYVKSRGATMSYIENHKYEKIRKEFRKKYNEFWDSIISFTTSEFNLF